MLTHIVRHIFRKARPTSFKLGTRMEDDDPYQPQAHDLQGQTSKSHGHVISPSRLGPMLYHCQRPAGAYRVGRTRRPHFLFIYALCHRKLWSAEAVMHYPRCPDVS